MYTKEILNILPENLKTAIGDLIKSPYLQEIRIRVNRSLILQVGSKEVVCGYIPKLEDLKIIIQRMSNYSIYAFEEEIKQGYITIKGGHRVGICGRCIIERGEIKTIKDIASINIRICREIISCSDPIMKFLINGDEIINTIIISPPKAGKTTLIRDIVRNISGGMQGLDLTGKKVCVIDERSEIGACFNGVPQMNVGVRTDVLDGCPKSQGIIMAIRSMSPDVIVCDEIGTYSDMDSILGALNSGISLITSIHGYGIEDLYGRPVFKEIVDNKIFKRAIVLSSRKGPGTVEYVYDFTDGLKIWGG
ncbi:stage III sporulation protein AA [Clostridium luticellarii]|uniref:stage III sporulation protein AA n=1 Tax=Clostridium luticellarii TaxID=1691940 RepID=UPI001A9A4F15|nr:stage III sporulation protein AA [Clostridium luticellarii]MCI1943743.1 stage III sporulation protein AA [Clostridium luticellarii]MCI1967004.1 stage III sporulation protein AA [Clostridium luticellarii]MCI1994371.1 stage III sporulation protein AA [Clostridium luticellarii]MCI2038676.1 stage III sporulation protein AA [Clostridium luticellarii]